MKNILITGGLGYIGGRLADFFKTKHPEINITLTTRKDPGNIPKWTSPFSIIKLDMLTPEKVDLSGIDTIIHLAATNEIISAEKPELAEKINVDGTKKLLANALKCKAKKFIYFSTFHVYSTEPGEVITEESPTAPTHPYAKTHLDAERKVLAVESGTLNCCILRLSNAFGYPMDRFVDRWSLVCNDLCRQAVLDGRLTLKSAGTQHRNFITLEDTARAVEHILNLSPSIWNKNIYNLGGEKSLSIKEMAGKIAELFAMKYSCAIPEIEIPQEDASSDNPVAVRYCIDKLLNTGFKLKNNFENEIMKTFDIAKEFENG